MDSFHKSVFFIFFPRISRWPLKSFLTKGGGDEKLPQDTKNDFPQSNCKPSSGIRSMDRCLKMKETQRSELTFSTCSCQ